MQRETGQRYISFLLRLWRSRGNAGTQWRASLQPAGENQAHGFGSLKELFAFLTKIAGEEDEATKSQANEAPDAGPPTDQGSEAT